MTVERGRFGWFDAGAVARGYRASGRRMEPGRFLDITYVMPQKQLLPKG